MAEGGFGAFVAGSIVGKIILDKSGWDSSVAKVEKDTGGLVGKFNSIGGALRDVSKGIATIGGAVFGTMVALIDKTADYGDQLNDLSQQTGISTETLGSYKLVADTTGTSLEGIAMAMRGLSSNMIDADKGTASAVNAFNALGVSIYDSQGKLLSLEEMLPSLADRFSQMEDGAKKLSLATDVFGKRGMELIPMLNLGRQGISELTSKAKELGLALSSEAAKAGDEFNDKLAILKASLQGAAIQLGMALMPILTKFIEKATEIIGHVANWVKNNQSLIESLGGAALKAAALMSAAILLSNPLYALAAAAAACVVIFLQLQDAEDKALQSAERANEANLKLRDTLKEAADQAGISRLKFHELEEKYRSLGNEEDTLYARMALAIKQGKESKELQEALINISEKHGEAYRKQQDEMKKEQEERRRALLGLNNYKIALTELGKPLMSAWYLQMNLDEGMKEWVQTLNAQVLPAMDETKQGLLSLAMSVDFTGQEFDEVMGRTAETAERTTSRIAEDFGYLAADIALESLKIPKSIDDALDTLPPLVRNVIKGIYDIFAQGIADIIKKWVTDLIEGAILNKTKEAAAGAASSLGGIGTAATTLATGIATMITTIATALASALVAIATGIATAAGIIAAAAPAILVAGAVAAALYGVFGAISKALGGGGGSKERQLLQNIRDFDADILNRLIMIHYDEKDIGGTLMADCDGLVGRVIETRDAVIYSHGLLQGIIDAIGKIRGAQHGSISRSNELLFVHGSPNVPEITVPAPIYQSNLRAAAALGAASGGSASPIQIFIEGKEVALPLRSSVRKLLIELIPQLGKNEQIKFHANAQRVF